MNATTTERMPRFLKMRIPSSTSSSSSGVPTRPSGGRMRSVTAIRLRRFTSGRDCQGTSKWSEKLWGRLWRAMCRMSRKLRVVSMPTSAPVCSMVMLVATVVPWTTRSMSSRVTPAISQSSSRPLSTPTDWSSGVLWTLCTNTPRSDSSTRSVFVPPTSTPTRAPISSSCCPSPVAAPSSGLPPGPRPVHVPIAGRGPCSVAVAVAVVPPLDRSTVHPSSSSVASTSSGCRPGLTFPNTRAMRPSGSMR